MADLNTEQLQEALDRLAENFTGFGSSMDARSRAISDSDDTQRKTERELSKFGLNIEERNKQIQKELEIQEELDKKIKESIPGYDGMTKAQQENIKTTRQQETATQDTLKKLKEQNDSIQGLTREQYAAIEAQVKLNKRKQEDADSNKHQGDKVTSTFGQLSTTSGILSLAQQGATEKWGSTAAGALGVNLAFAALSAAVSYGTLGFNQWVESLDVAFQAQLEYNQQLVLGADGYKLANSQLLKSIQLEAKQARERSDYYKDLTFKAATLGVGLAGLGTASLLTGRAIMGITGPIGILFAVISGIIAWWTGTKAIEERNQAQASEAAAKNLEAQNELTDKLFQTFNEIGNAGMTGANGMTELGDNAHRAGFALKNIDKFANILKNNQREISMFGSTAVEGARNFADVTGTMTEKFGMHFRKLGMDQESQAAATEKYMALQAKLGLLQGKTVTEQAEGAAKYLDELDKTATLLGQSRKEQEDARAAIMAIEQGQAAMMDAREKGDTPRANELDRALKAAAAIQKMDPKVAAGLMKIVSSRGAAIDDDTIKALQSIPKTIRDVRSGAGTEFSRSRGATGELGRTYASTAENFAATGADMGLSGGYYGAVLMQQERQQRQDKEAEKIAAETGVKKGTPEFEKILEKISTREEASDAATKQAAALAKSQQDAAIARDSELLPFLKKMGSSSADMTAGMTTFGSSLASSSGILNSGANTIMEAAKKMWEVAFGKSKDPTPKSTNVVAAETKATESRQLSENATQSLLLIEDRKKAAETELKAMYRRGASQEELANQNKKLTELGKEQAEAQRKEILASQEKMQDALVAKTERLRQRKLENTLEPLVRETASIQEKLNKLKAEKEEIEKEGKLRPGTSRDQNDRKLMLQGVTEDIENIRKELEEKLKQVSAIKTQLTTTAPIKPQSENEIASARTQRQGATPTTSTPAAPAAPATAAKATAAPAPSSQGVQSEKHASASTGSTTPKLTSVSSKSGKSASVGLEYATQFQKLIDYLDASKYEIVSMGGYNNRDVRGKPGLKSIHAYGGALDINESTNPSKPSTLVTDMPSEISNIAGGLGLGWGGNWSTPKDPMHFSAAESEGGSLLKAKKGGVFNGPVGGYPVELHKREAIVPLPDPTSKIKIETPTKEPLDSVMSRLDTYNASSGTSDTPNNVLNDMMATLIEMMENKMDTMIDKLDVNNTYSDKLVKAMA